MTRAAPALKGGGGFLQTDSMCVVDYAGSDEAEEEAEEDDDLCMTDCMEIDSVPMAPAPGEASKNKAVAKDTFTELVNLQSASGAFQWGPVFLELLAGGGDMNAIFKASPPGEESSAWLTALAIKVCAAYC